MSLEELSYFIAMAGTVAFASSAILSLTNEKIDLFAALVFGTITAVGGGTIRDLIINEPVFWSEDISYIWVSIATNIIVFYLYRLFARRVIRSLFLYVDAIAIAMFGIQATSKVWNLGFGLPIAPLLMGVITAIGGGIIRDVLMQRQTLLMSRELYAVPVMVGCTLFSIVLAFAPEYHYEASIICLFVIFLLRAAAIHWNLTMPKWLTLK